MTTPKIIRHSQCELESPRSLTEFDTVWRARNRGSRARGGKIFHANPCCYYLNNVIVIGTRYASAIAGKYRRHC
jgi:hypothetical protein